MKKLHKILSLALAVGIVVCSLVTSAFAEGDGSSDSSSGSGSGVTPETTTITEITQLAASKTVTIGANAAIPQTTFTIKMVPANAEQVAGEKINDTVDVSQGLELATDTVSLTFGATVEDTSTGSVTKTGYFDLTSFKNGAYFPRTGVYRYYVTETIPTDKPSYITYDEHQYQVDLYVYPDSSKESGLSIQDIVTKRVGDDAKPQTINFENEFDMADIEISKTVKGYEFTAGEAFDFYIKIPVGGTTIVLAQNQEIHAEIWDATGVVNDNVKLKVNGTNDSNNVQRDGTLVQLKHGQTLKITAPVSMVYYVEEADYSGEGYATTWSYTEAGTFQDGRTVTKKSVTDQRVVDGTTNTDTNKVDFVNERDLSAQTGIVLDVMPYAIVMAIAVAGAVFFIVKKRNAR
jgi:hypothetical protein